MNHGTIESFDAATGRGVIESFGGGCFCRFSFTDVGGKWEPGTPVFFNRVEVAVNVTATRAEHIARGFPNLPDNPVAPAAPDSALAAPLDAV